MKPLDQKGLIGTNSPNQHANLQSKSVSHNSILDRLLAFAATVPDFRRTGKGNIRHRLADIIVLMILARMSKCIYRADIIVFGGRNLGKFQKMGLLRNGVPSEPTLCRIENGIDELAFADKMREFMEEFQIELMKVQCVLEIICIDGKALRGTIQENGRNPDIVSAYSYNTGIVLATEACDQKSNEIKAAPRLLDKIDIKGKVVTGDAMFMQKEIIDKIREKGGDFLIELKANQRALRYGVEDKLKVSNPVYAYTEEAVLDHGRIETRSYRIYDGLELIADKEKWGADLTIIEYESDTVDKSTMVQSSEKRLYASSLSMHTPKPGSIVRGHWSIETMHWAIDVNLKQDMIKRKSTKSARNLDTILRIVYSLFSIWKGLRKKLTDKKKGMAELQRIAAPSFTKLIGLLNQK